jgi:predicted RNA polymerase sigma factor
VLSLVFDEGYAATAGEDLTRPALCREAMRLGRSLPGLVPGESEVHGLLALMERLAARIGPDGESVLLADQDRSRWDRVLVNYGLSALERAQEAATGALGPTRCRPGSAACHARARSVEDRLGGHRRGLRGARRAQPFAGDRAEPPVAVSRAYGPAAGLELVDRLLDVPALAGYHLLPAVRGGRAVPPGA